MPTLTFVVYGRCLTLFANDFQSHDSNFLMSLVYTQNNVPSDSCCMLTCDPLRICNFSNFETLVAILERKKRSCMKPLDVLPFLSLNMRGVDSDLLQVSERLQLKVRV